MAIIPDWTLLLQMVNFIILIFLMNAVLYKPIRKILIERQKKVTGYEEDISTLQQDAADANESFQNQIGEAKAKGFREREALKEAAQEEERRLLDEINEKAQADLQAVREQVAQEAQSAREKLKAQAEAFSLAIAEKILGRSVS